MKQFNRLIVWVIVIGLGIMTVFSYIAFSTESMNANKGYVIEANRIAHQMNNGVLLTDIEIDQASDVLSLDWIEENADSLQIEQFFNGAGVNGGTNFMIKPIYEGERLVGYLRMTYDVPNHLIPAIIVIDIILLLTLVTIVLVLVYLKRQIIKPFHVIENMPLELSKGRLNQGIKESESRFFGKFIWGLDLLRETLESQRKENLRLEKDRQTLIASLSHELKTPVSAIKLYSAALYNNLYENEKKRQESAKLIEEKAEQIEELIGEIITTSASSLNDFEIQNEAFYLSEWIDRAIYSNQEKLALLKIKFEIEQVPNKLLVGDLERLVEVFDNIIENAIKYGDGDYISVSFYEEDYRQLIRIENSGTPISPNELPHIFSSFWRGSNVDNKPGNGLGLYIGKQLLQKMGGDIFAETKDHVVAIVLVVRF